MPELAQTGNPASASACGHHSLPAVYDREKARTVAAALTGAGIDFAVYLPDSVLHPVLWELEADPSVTTVCCAREDEGVAIAMGADYAGGYAAALMEASGLGLSRLILPRAIDVCHSEILVVASHTSSGPGERTHYHAATRRCSDPLLDELRIPYTVLSRPGAAGDVFTGMIATMTGQRTPVAVLAPPDLCLATPAPPAPDVPPPPVTPAGTPRGDTAARPAARSRYPGRHDVNGRDLSQRELCEILACHRARYDDMHAGSVPAVTSPGTTGYDLYQAAPEQPTLFQMELGYATAICLGYALRAPDRKVVAIEGDGSLTAGLHVLSTIGRYQPPGLIVVAVDNGCYGAIQDASYPAFPTAVNLAAVARACGITNTVTVTTAAAAEAAIDAAFREPGPWFIAARVKPSPLHGEPENPRLLGLGSWKPGVHENAMRFAHDMRKQAAIRHGLLTQQAATPETRPEDPARHPGTPARQPQTPENSSVRQGGSGQVTGPPATRD